LEPAFSGCDDAAWVGSPDEGLGLGPVVLVDEAIDGGLEVDEGMKDATFEASPGEFGEEAFDGVGPGA